MGYSQMDVYIGRFNKYYNLSDLEDAVNLYNCRIVSLQYLSEPSKNKDVVLVIEGDDSDISQFSDYWSQSLEDRSMRW